VEVYAINDSLNNLLLVRNGKVINGSWKLASDKDGFHVPGNRKLRAQYLGKAPKWIQDEHGWCDYNAMLILAFDKFHLPLFDPPRTRADDERTEWVKGLEKAPVS